MMDIQKAKERFLVKVAMDSELNYLRNGLVLKMANLFEESLLETEEFPKPKTRDCLLCSATVYIEKDVYFSRHPNNTDEFGVICESCAEKEGIK